jgi:D-amino peptidase
MNTRTILPMVLWVALLCAFAGCGRQAPSAVSAPWSEVPLRIDTGDGVAILLAYDMEGISGLDDWRMFDANFSEYERGRELLTGDVNAVVDGLFAGGATRVDVVDFHGSGNDEADVLIDRMDPRAKHVERDTLFWEFDLVQAGAYDAIVVVGMHCKPGSGGFAPHTCGYAMEVSINGQTITEAEWQALLWGEVGVPLIFVSGDDQLAGDLSTLPWIEYVAVKTAINASRVTLRPLEEAYADLRAAAARSVNGLATARAIAARAPVEVGLRAYPPSSLDALDGVPGVDYRDGTVFFESPSLVEAGPGINAILDVASASLAPIAYEKLDSLMGLGPSLRAFYTKVSERWLDYQSGTWAPEPEDSSETQRSYYGGE